MSQPEISHRCPSCGATARETDALFCRECGKPLAGEAEKTESAETGDGATAESPGPETSPEPPTEPQAAAEVATPVSDQQAPAENLAPEDQPEVSLKTEPDTSTPPAARRGDKTRERLHRASEVARGVTRGVMEEPAKRVEKIRQVSTVVLEEASYDPSLRFVLVALGLFVVFIILLVLSKVMS